MGAELYGRAGRFIQQPTGYRAFIPAPLPPDPGLRRDAEFDHLLSAADRALGQLEGVTSILPEPDFFVAMYVRYEALLSSQIEGTQSTLEDVLAFEAEPSANKEPRAVEEVINHIQAMRHGLRRLSTLPISLRLLREIHQQLMDGVRGGERSPGEFRHSQNWIGPQGCTLQNAAFVPPPPHEMQAALGDLELFLHADPLLPPLILSGLAHAQFETIHPFLDGNGRIGRLLITFLLCQRSVLSQPMLYLSHYLKRHRTEYYERLTAVREKGDWEGWMKFFLKGVAEVSIDSARRARQILELREEARRKIILSVSNTQGALSLLDSLFKAPLTHVRAIARHCEIAYPTANRLAHDFVRLGFLEEMTGGARNRRFRFKPYLDLFPEPPVLSQETQAAMAGQRTLSL